MPDGVVFEGNEKEDEGNHEENAPEHEMGSAIGFRHFRFVDLRAKPLLFQTERRGG